MSTGGGSNGWPLDCGGSSWMVRPWPGGALLAAPCPAAPAAECPASAVKPAIVDAVLQDDYEPLDARRPSLVVKQKAFRLRVHNPNTVACRVDVYADGQRASAAEGLRIAAGKTAEVCVTMRLPPGRRKLAIVLTPDGLEQRVQDATGAARSLLLLPRAARCSVSKTAVLFIDYELTRGCAWRKDPGYCKPCDVGPQ